MGITLLCQSLFVFGFGLIAQYFGIRTARRVGLMETPCRRRRHEHPTPVVGGLGVFCTWFLAWAVYLTFNPSAKTEILPTLLPLSGGLLLLIGTGLADDLMSLKPLTKLLLQSAAAILVLTLEPHAHGYIVKWQQSVGVAAWPLAMIWIVGLTNAFNLIDGLDGLCAGTAVVSAGSIYFLSYYSGNAPVAALSTAFLIPSLLAFLVFNWNPAKVFLGDTGSLTIGFLLAVTSLIACAGLDATGNIPGGKWSQLLGLVMICGYPILDMGLAVWRRYRSRLSLWSADRNHLHHRLLRLDFNVSRSALILIGAGVCLQIHGWIALCFSPLAVGLSLASTIFEVLSFIFVIKYSEKSRISRVKQVYAQPTEARVAPVIPIRGKRDEPAVARQVSSAISMTIDLSPLFEAAIFEEKERHRKVVDAIELVLAASLRKGDEIAFNGGSINILFADDGEDRHFAKNMKQRLNKQIDGLFSLIGFHCSLAALPIRVEKMTSVERPITQLAQ